MHAAIALLVALAVPAHTPPVSDLAGVLTTEQEAALQTIVADGAAAGTMHLEVLTIDSMADWGVGDGSIESFAQQVFDTWGIGDAAANDGALIVVAVGDREARIELGAGFAGAYDAAMTTVMQESMLPRFRDGDFGGGIVAGAQQVIERLAGPADVPVPDRPVQDRPVQDRPAPAAGGDAGDGDGDGGDGDGNGVPWLGLGAGAVVVAGAAGGVAAARRPKKCPKCGAPCTLVGEADDDVYLDDGQRCEEFLDSVDHRAWRCSACSNVHLTHHSRLFRRTKRCETCGYRTARSSQRTVDEPSYTRSGKAIVTTTCEKPGCGHRTERTITLPQRQEQHATAAGFGSGFGGSGGHMGGGDMGGGDMGGGAGGGHSGGGGSTGSW